MRECGPGVSCARRGKGQYQAEAEWPLSRAGVKNQMQLFETPSILSPRPHTILHAHLLTNDYWATPPQRVVWLKEP